MKTTMIDAQLTERHDLVERYCRGQLDDAERREFEEYFLDKPDVIEQIELEMLLVDGMSAVAEKKSMTLAAGVARWRTSRYLPVAAVGLIAALAVSLLINVRDSLSPDSSGTNLGPPTLDSSIQLLSLNSTLSSDSGLQVNSSSPAQTLRVREGTNQVVVIIQLPQLETSPHEITLRRQDPPETVSRIAHIDPLGDGVLLFAVPRELLQPANYDLELRARSSQTIRTLQFQVVASAD